MPTKRLLDARRSRKALPRGFGWIDHRLLRDGYLGHCSPEALALYIFLVCAADAQGLSYYSEPRIAQVLRLEPPTLRQARRELLGLGLIAYQKPLYQLLSLEDERTAESPPRGHPGTSRSPSRRHRPLAPAACRSKPLSNGFYNKPEAPPRDRLRHLPSGAPFGPGIELNGGPDCRPDRPQHQNGAQMVGQAPLRTAAQRAPALQ